MVDEVMTIWEAILLGAVQGATEFLPVSSSGHLALLKSFLDLQTVPLLFDVLLHVATLVVVLAVFRRRVVAILRSLARWVVRRADDDDSENLRVSWVILVATVITGGLGFAIDRLDLTLSTKVISALLIVTGLILIGSRFLKGTRDYSTIGLKEGVIVGLGQAAGVFPGISRSGITISSGMAAGLSREKAGEFAFLVFIPAILGALVLTLGDAGELSSTVTAGALVTAFATALVVGLGALLVLVRMIRSGNLFLFSLYLIPLGIAGVVWL